MTHLMMCCLLLAQAPDPTTATTAVSAPTSWLSPEGIQSIALLATVVLGALGTLFSAIGWTKAATRANVSNKLLGVVVRGAERARGKVGVQAGTAFVKTIQEEAIAADVETLLNGVVKEATETSPTAPPEEAVRRGTARIPAPPPDAGPRRVS